MSNSPEDQSETKGTPISTFQQVEAKLYQPEGWCLSFDLFGDAGVNIHDFCAYNYTYFLDTVETRYNLERGLDELSPLADDALELVKMWGEDEFTRFKEELTKERAAEEDSAFPSEWHCLLIPKRFIFGMILAEQTEAPLGTALIRILEYEAYHE